MIRAVDVNGLDSGWVPNMQAGLSVSLDTLSPVLAVTRTFSPPAVGDTGPDGTTATTFAFTAASSNTPASFKWDLDGDGNADADTLVSGIPATARVNATYSYSRSGNYTLQVRAVDGYDQVWLWAFFSTGLQPEALEIAANAAAPPPETYCGGMTIEQLVASG